jgi:hypothetical protein
VRQASLEGRGRFRQAELMPITARDKEITDRHNLKAYSGFYSLQVAYYGPRWEGDRRKAAEGNAKALREYLDQSVYYYHGANFSSVTIGLFTKDEAQTTRRDPMAPGRGKVQAHSKRVRELRKRFGENYANQADLVEMIQNDKPAPGGQPSGLVEVP